ncbi:FAR-17a/AIG1-like protein-domain-containing protein [Mycena metata]|uniref:FAR-17a/AIG1-like protein-domain-containing protein n=1 Tax=Mycena metata TaxID=1033252 RepID=A0AAD7NTP6_9AGAR|nr:FAR-17a/AIG1-like protein-domain-containing protein [Mycena metata]
MAHALSVLLHVGAISAMTYGLHGLGLSSWIATQYGGHFQYLTIQGRIRAIKRTLFIAAMPIATVVSSIYWTLLLTFPHLILQALPESPDSPMVLPLRVDLSLHAVPAISLLLDFMVFERKYGRSASLSAVPITVFCTVWYGWWVELCASKNGTFPYPFLTLNPLETRIGIYAGACIVACISFYGLNALHPKSR